MMEVMDKEKDGQEENSVEYDPEIDELIVKMGVSREELEGDLKDLVGLKDKLQTLFPSEVNYRTKFILEEKIKAATSFYSAILNIRQEINKSVSSEIEIRRKLSSKTDSTAGFFDIRKLAEEIEEAKNQQVTFKREETEEQPEKEPESDSTEQK